MKNENLVLLARICNPCLTIQEGTDHKSAPATGMKLFFQPAEYLRNVQFRHW